MPPTKDQTIKPNFSRSFSNNETSMSAKVYHPATNLMPASPPLSPTGPFPPRSTGWGRQTSSNGKYS